MIERKTLSLAAISCSVVLAAAPALANTIFYGGNAVLGASTADIQVSGALGGSPGADQVVGGDLTLVFGDGNVEDFAFFNTIDFQSPHASGNEVQAGDPDAVLAAFSEAVGTGISDITVPPVADFGNNNNFQLNGAGQGTVRAPLITGVIDVSAYESGTIYFLHGASNGNINTVTLEGVPSGDLTSIGGDQRFATVFTFDTTGGDGILEWTFTNNDNDGSPGSRSRWQGIVIDAKVPEPGSAMLLGFGLLLLGKRRRSR